MTSFDPAEHPRTGGGQFTTKARTEPTFTLDMDTQTEADYEAAAARLETLTQRVADLLPSNVVAWEGDGPAIYFGAREAHDNFGDYAFVRLPADGFEDTSLDYRWQFSTEDFPEKLESGYHNAQEVAEHLTVDSDPHEVAAWIREQMDKHGTPALVRHGG